MNEQAYLDALVRKYITPIEGKPFACEWHGYVTCYIFADRMGQIQYRVIDGTYTGLITLDDAFKGFKPLTQRAALYHEFCHAEAWYEENAKGHETPWIKRWMRKPILSLAGAFTTCFWFIAQKVAA